MLDHFHIRGFRGYSETHLPIATRTAIIGGNGSGKTHILEAIHLASCGSIHYIQAPRYEDALFEMIYTHDIGPKSYSRERREKKDIFSIQGAKVTGIKYQENLPFRSVFISPFDMNLFYFAPGFRRDFVDSILERSFAQFRKTRRDYEMILRQRNALLKKIREGEAKKTDLTYWNKVFIEQAEVYHLYRMRWHTFVMRHLENITHLLGKYEILYVLESKIEEQEKKPENTSDRATLIGSYLDENLERDILTGHTHI